MANVNTAGQWWSLTIIPMDGFPKWTNESEIKEYSPVSLFEEWFVQIEMGQNGMNQYSMLFKTKRTLKTRIVSLFGDYTWFDVTNLKNWDTDFLHQLEKFIDINEYYQGKSELHVSNNPRRKAGPWSNFIVHYGQELTDLVATSPLPWQKDVLKMMAMQPSGQVIWIYYPHQEPSSSKQQDFRPEQQRASNVNAFQYGASYSSNNPFDGRNHHPLPASFHVPSIQHKQKVQGKTLFVKYIEERGLAQVIYVSNFSQLKNVHIKEINENPQKHANIFFCYRGKKCMDGWHCRSIFNKIKINHPCTVFFFLNSNHNVAVDTNHPDLANVFPFAIQGQKLVDA